MDSGSEVVLHGKPIADHRQGGAAVLGQAGYRAEVDQEGRASALPARSEAITAWKSGTCLLVLSQDDAARAERKDDRPLLPPHALLGVHEQRPRARVPGLRGVQNARDLVLPDGGAWSRAPGMPNSSAPACARSALTTAGCTVLPTNVLVISQDESLIQELAERANAVRGLSFRAPRLRRVGNHHGVPAGICGFRSGHSGEPGHRAARGACVRSQHRGARIVVAVRKGSMGFRFRTARSTPPSKSRFTLTRLWPL